MTLRTAVLLGAHATGHFLGGNNPKGSNDSDEMSDDGELKPVRSKSSRFS